MKLLEYLKDNKITFRAFAKTIERNELTVARIANGNFAPSIETLARIRQETHGLVDIEDFLSPTPGDK